MIIAITGIGEKSAAYNGYHIDKAYSFAELCQQANYEKLLATINTDTILIGHSAGSLAALSIAAEHPLAQLILIGPGLELTDTSELLARDPQTPVTIDKTNPSFIHYVAQHPTAEMQIAEQFRITAAAALNTVLAAKQATFIFAENELAKQQYTEALLKKAGYPYQVIADCNHYDILNQPATRAYINDLL